MCSVTKIKATKLWCGRERTSRDVLRLDGPVRLLDARHAMRCIGGRASGTLVEVVSRAGSNNHTNQESQLFEFDIALGFNLDLLADSTLAGLK
jgi:hypothetical protein